MNEYEWMNGWTEDVADECRVANWHFSLPNKPNLYTQLDKSTFGRFASDNAYWPLVPLQQDFSAELPLNIMQNDP